jgi:hypothetical protein
LHLKTITVKLKTLLQVQRPKQIVALPRARI